MRPGCIFNVGFIKLTLNFSILEITRKLIQYVHSPVFLLPGAKNVTKLSLKWLYLAICNWGVYQERFFTASAQICNHL